MKEADLKSLYSGKGKTMETVKKKNQGFKGEGEMNRQSIKDF